MISAGYSILNLLTNTGSRIGPIVALAKSGLLALARRSACFFSCLCIMLTQPPLAVVETNNDKKTTLVKVPQSTTEALSLSLQDLANKAGKELPQKVANKLADSHWLTRAWSNLLGNGALSENDKAELQALETTIDAQYTEALAQADSDFAALTQRSATKSPSPASTQYH